MIYRSVACGKGSRCHGNPKPDWSEVGGEGAHRPNALPRAHTHTHARAHERTHGHVASDQDYERDSVQGPTYKVMESRAGDIRGRAALTGVNKITVGRSRPVVVVVGGGSSGGGSGYRSTAKPNDKQIHHNSSGCVAT